MQISIWQNTYGSSSTLQTLLFNNVPDVSPGNVSFLTKSPVALKPICVATPICTISILGISCACSARRSNNHPLLTPLVRVPSKKSHCFLSICGLLLPACLPSCPDIPPPKCVPVANQLHVQAFVTLLPIADVCPINTAGSCSS